MKQELLQLCKHPGPSGFEGTAAVKVLEHAVQKSKIDRLGNVLGLISHGAARTVLLDAHLDEVGLMVTGCEDGLLTFTPLGGIDARILPAQEVWVLTNSQRPGRPPVYGVVTCKPPHTQSEEELESAMPIKDLRIDVGGADNIPVGTPVVWATEPCELTDGVLCGKALDDRAGFIVLLLTLQKLLDKPLPVELVICGSVQEERALRGAASAAFGVCPDVCVAVDVTHGRTPDAPKDRTFACGGGVCIGVGPSLTRSVSDSFIRLAKQHGIPYQLEVMEGHTGTNAWVLQTAREGVPAGLLSVPLRYMHTPVEMLFWQDIEACADLLAAWILEGAVC